MRGLSLEASSDIVSLLLQRDLIFKEISSLIITSH
jgi:hypothetical protein